MIVKFVKPSASRVAVTAANVLLFLAAAGAARAGVKPDIMESCKICHKAEAATVFGTLLAVSEQFKTVSVNVGPLVWVIKYTDDLQVKEGEKTSGPAALQGIPRDREIAVTYTGDETQPVAARLSVKQPHKIPEAQLMNLEELQALLKTGPEEGKYTLVDSRPGPAFAEGHIPYAVSLFYGDFKDKAATVLPDDKGQLVVFYGGGNTCTLGPLSAREAEKLGHTNIKVFHAGFPAWKMASGLVLLEPTALQSWIRYDDAYVLVDLRAKQVAQNGFIHAAVNVPAGELASWQEKFPKDLKAPIVLYDEAQATPEQFATVRGWGYTNTAVLRGGLTSWEGELEANPMADKIEYVKKLKAGELPLEEFRKIVDVPPPNVLILDVREGAVDSRLKTATAIPQNELAGRLAEVPKDREIVVFCNTGALAQTAYDLLTAQGYPKVGYLNAVLQIGADGKYELTEK